MYNWRATRGAESRKAVKEQDRAGLAGILDEFSESCVRQVIAAIEELLAVIPANCMIETF